MAEKYINLPDLITFWDEVKKRIPRKTSHLTNDSGFITRNDVATSTLPGTMTAADKIKLDSIDPNQLVDVDDALSTTSTNPVENKVITVALNNKVDSETGKGLSTNDYTTAEKTKLANIEAGAEKNIIEVVKRNGTNLPVTNKTVNIAVPVNVSDLVNDLGYAQIIVKSTSDWNQDPSVVSIKDAIYVYSDYGTDGQGNGVPGVKIGDGQAYVIDLPFTDAINAAHRNNSDIHVTLQDKQNWNNKVRCYYSELYPERVVFTTD